MRAGAQVFTLHGEPVEVFEPEPRGEPGSVLLDWYRSREAKRGA